MMNDQLPLLLWLVVPAVVGETAFLFLSFLYLRKRKVKSNRRANLALMCLSVPWMVLTAFAGGECYYRFVYDTSDAMASTKLAQRWVDRYFVGNDAGFRDDVAYRLAGDPGVRRISFVGDSFTVGHGIKRIQDRFVNIIRAKHPEWEIQMLAKPGSDTGAEIDRIRALQEVHYQFDVVVLVYCLNDVADLYPEWTATVHRIYEDPNRHNWFLRHSFFLDFIYNRIRLSREPYARDYYAFVRSGYRGEVWTKQKERLRQFSDLVRNSHGRLLVVTFPFVHRPEPRAEYEHAHEVLAAFWAELGVPYLDLHDAFTNLPASRLVVNSSDPHPNELANRIAAQWIAPFIEANMDVAK